MNTSLEAHQKDRYRILYVGTSLKLLDQLKRKFGPVGCRVVRCPGGSQARLLIQSNIRYDLMLFDQELVGLDCRELVVLVRLLSHRQHTPVVINTAGGPTLKGCRISEEFAGGPGKDHALIDRIHNILLECAAARSGAREASQSEQLSAAVLYTSAVSPK